MAVLDQKVALITGAKGGLGNFVTDAFLQAGAYSLISIALLLMMVGLLLAAQLLMETSKLFAETAGEASDTPVPLVLARIRGDVQVSAAAAPVLQLDGSLGAITMAFFCPSQFRIANVWPCHSCGTPDEQEDLCIFQSASDLGIPVFSSDQSSVAPRG